MPRNAGTRRRAPHGLGRAVSGPGSGWENRRAPAGPVLPFWPPGRAPGRPRQERDLAGGDGGAQLQKLPQKVLEGERELQEERKAARFPAFCLGRGGLEAWRGR